MTIKRQDKDASAIVTALETAVGDIRVRHTDMPRVVITLAGSRRKLGHYSHDRWAGRSGKISELFIAGEHLRSGPEGVLGTLLHEAAHGLGAARGIQNTSRDGRYHNKRYAALAAEVGLEAERLDSRGWATTTFKPGTVDAYAPTLGRLDKAIALYRQGDPAPKAPVRNLALAICECDPGRRIRVAPATYALGPIACLICKRPFTVTAPIAS